MRRRLSLPALLVAMVTMLGAAPAVRGQCMPLVRPGPVSLTGIRTMVIYQGQLAIAGDLASLNNTGRWDGSAWQPFGTGPGRIAEKLFVFNDELYVSGSFPGAVKRWTGSAWMQVGSPVPGSAETFAIYHGELYIGGIFTVIGGRTVNRVARWDGTDWQPVGTGCNGEVITLGVSNDRLIAGGQFTAAGGGPAAHIASWDGSAWSALGAGTDAAVTALTVYRGELIAGGPFQSAGGRPATSVARFDGSDWHDIGGGLSGVAFPGGLVSALAVYQDQLVVAGNFKFAGSTPANYLARWTGDRWAAIAGYGTFPYTIALLGDDFYAAGIAVQAPLRRYRCVACPADLNDDGRADFTDYMMFLDRYDDRDLVADLNGDGLVEFTDYLVFIDNYATGCP